MNRDDYYSKRERLQQERPVSLEFLSCKELPHFVGYGSDGSPRELGDGESFECQIAFYQEDKDTDISFRFAGARIEDDAIVEFSATGVPDELHESVMKRILATYFTIYPNGLTMEMMSA